MFCQPRPMVVLMFICVLCLISPPTSGHGRLWDPPGRSTMWRSPWNYNTPKNYNDNELFCGGFKHQVSQGYKCGVCGDAYDLPDPRPHEANGKYAKGIIVKEYEQGGLVDLTAEITANHLGWIEFKICPINDPTKKADQSCFDQYPLELQDSSGSKLYIGKALGKISVPVRLPADLTCDFCTVQWRYHAGNSWGTEPNGTGCVGCGYQEEFYGCADVKILPLGTNRQVSTSQSTTNRPQSCRGNIGMEAYTEWCATNCAIGYCPGSHCMCDDQNETRSHVSETTSEQENTASMQNTTPTVKSGISKEQNKTPTTRNATPKANISTPSAQSQAIPSQTQTLTAKMSTSSIHSQTPPTQTHSPSKSEVTTSKNSTDPVQNETPATKIPSRQDVTPGARSNPPSGHDEKPSTKCVAFGDYAKEPRIILDGWCQVNCALGYCPDSLCKCS